MTRQQLHDFLLRQVEGFIEDSLFQSAIHKTDVNSHDSEPFYDITTEVENEFKKSLLANLEDNLDEIDVHLTSISEGIFMVASQPRFNNDNVLSFLMDLYAGINEEDSVQCWLFKSVLKDVIWKLKRIPSSLISKLPDKLCTKEAITLLEKGRKAGMLDNNYKPVADLPDYVAAMMADRIGLLLDINPKRKWYIFRKYWGMDNLRQRFEEADKYNEYPYFFKKIREVFN